MKRIIYFFYYLFLSDWRNIRKWAHYVSSKEKEPLYKIYFYMCANSILYGASFQDFFIYNLLNKKKAEKEKYAFTSFMYEFFLKVNPKKERKILNNKILFLQSYSEFVSRRWISKKKLSSHSLNDIQNFFYKGKVVFKYSCGVGGSSIKIRNIVDFTSKKELIMFMKNNKVDLIEEYVYQHDKIHKISPKALNTLRIVTAVRPNQNVDIMSVRMRFADQGSVDNMHQGGFSVVVNKHTGIIESDGVYRDISKNNIKSHPLTLETLKGFQIPFWLETLEFVKKASLKNVGNKSIGWDVAITKSGPELIEGNHNWNHAIVQQTGGKGLKEKLMEYLKDLDL